MSLKYKAVLGAIWSIASSVGGRIIGLLGTLAITHFLTPEQYGTVSVGVVLVGTVNGLTILGFGQYVTAHPDESDETVFHASLIHLVTGVLGFGGILLLAGPLERWFDAPGLQALLPGIVLALFFERLAYMPGRVLARDLRFRVLAMRLLFGETAYAAVAVVLAMMGHGAMSLVWAMLVRQGIAVLITVGALERRQWFAIGPVRWATTRKMLSFSIPMAAATWLHWLSRRGDNLLVAGLFGPAAVGRYNLAYNLADVPATQVGEHIGDVLLPSFAKMKDPETRKRTLVRASGLLGLIVFPMAVGLALVAKPLVRTVLGEAWWDLAPLLAVLSSMSVVRPVGWLVGAYLQAQKRTRTVLVLEGAKTAAIFAFVLLLGQVSLFWACAGIGVAFAGHSFASLWVVDRYDRVGMARLLKPLARPLLACVPMVACCLLTQTLVQRYRAPSWAVLVTTIAAGAISYVVSALYIASTQSSDLLGLLREVMGGPPDGAPASAPSRAPSETIA